jgi:hypothetical protein
MKRYLTANDIANNVRMMRTQHSGAILIVEGNIDLRFYKRFVNETKCKLTSSNGKDNAIKAVDILEKNEFNGVLTIVDADFWRLDGIKPNSPNLLLTDTHDLETMILSSDSFDTILLEFGSAPKIRKFGKPLRETLLESALPIGLFRWLSSPNKDNLYLSFKDLSFDKFVDKKTLSVDVDSLIKEVKNNSHNSTLDENAIKIKIIALKKARHNPWQVCSGHDLVQILSIGLKNIFGNIRAQSITKETVDGIVRTAYDSSCFYSTQLYNSIKDWEKANDTFNVL